MCNENIPLPVTLTCTDLNECVIENPSCTIADSGNLLLSWSIVLSNITRNSQATLKFFYGNATKLSWGVSSLVTEDKSTYNDILTNQQPFPLKIFAE